MEIDKRQYLLENGWWAHYHDDCWFDGKLDKLDVDDKGFMVGFRPESEGITLEKAFKIVYEKDRIITTEKDRQVFFDAVFSNRKPIQSLVAAAKKSKENKEVINEYKSKRGKRS